MDGFEFDHYMALPAFDSFNLSCSMQWFDAKAVIYLNISRAHHALHIQHNITLAIL